MSHDYHTFAFDQLPKLVKDPKTVFNSESTFCHFLVQERMAWRHLGLDAPDAWRSNQTPDIITTVKDSKTKKRPRGTLFGVEVEVEPKNFILHGHQKWNVHLVISLHAPWYRRNVCGINIISLYRQANDGMYRMSWSDDIAIFYHGYKSELWEFHKDDDDGDDA
jgi:hypothetical protein